MSEKRFKLDFDNHSQGAIMDRQDKYGQYCRLYDFGEVGRQQIVDLLNEQQATIKQLQEELELTANTKLWSRRKLEEENKQLRQQVKDWKFINDFQEKEIDALKEALKEKEYVEEENEQLKKELNNLKKDETLLYHYYTLARYGGDGV